MKRAKNWIIIAVLLLVLTTAFYLFIRPGKGKPAAIDKLKRMNIILITLDTLRADFLSVYHRGKAQTPHIDGVAEEGVVFDRCVSQTPLTLPSHTSILSGAYPLHHQIRDNGGFLVPQELEMVSEALQANGFATSAFIASYVLHSKWGINQGFDTYSDEFDLTKFKKVSLGIVQKRADEVLNNAMQWLNDFKSKKGRSEKKRFFTWIHLYDPHTPYDPPSPYKEKYPRDPYRGEVEYMDAQLGRFFQFLKDKELYDNSLIIMAADHGESLGQHGERTHGFFIYQSTVWVPMIIRAPFRFPVNRVSQLVELIDIAPTILEAANLSIPASYQGRSVLGLMLGEKEREKKVAYTETYYPRLHYGWSELKALYYDNHWKYILAPKEELYDLINDANEEENLVLKKSYQARQVKNQILKFIREQSLDARKPGEAKRLDKDDLQRLAALGYLTTVVDTSGKQNLPDPKGKVHVFNRLSQAKEMMSRKNYEKAVEILKGVIREDPHIVDGILQLGNAYSKLRQWKEALEQYYRALELKPDYNTAMINVLNCLIGLGDLDKGIEESKRFLKTFPSDHSLYNELATFYILKTQYDLALETLNKSLEVEKINPSAMNKIAGIHLERKQFSQAEKYLNDAYAINSRLKKIHYHMAQVEEAKGNTGKAIELYKKELDYYPGDFKAAYNLAEDLRKGGEYSEAIPYYNMSIKSNPGFNIPYFMIAKYYFDGKEKLDEVEQLCKKGIALQPVNKYTAFGHYILADLYSFKNDREKYSFHLAKAQAIRQKLQSQNKW